MPSVVADPVSVIIPHYGDTAHALALVDQLVAQVGAPEFEIIVVDDASPDPYPQDNRVRLIRRARNGGFGAAVNTGAADARYPSLLVLNSDVTIAARFVGELCSAAAPFQPAVVSPMIFGYDGASQWPGRKFPRTSHYFRGVADHTGQAQTYAVAPTAIDHPSGDLAAANQPPATVHLPGGGNPYMRARSERRAVLALRARYPIVTPSRRFATYDA